MNLLFLGDEEELDRLTVAGEGESLPPFVFGSRLPAPPGPWDVDAAVVPADRFILECQGPFMVPVFACGGPDLVEEAFESGCTDYLRVPWSAAELLSRFKAARGRFSRLPDGGLRIEGDRLEGEAGEAKLPPGCLALLDILVANCGWPVPRETLRMALGIAPGEGRSVDMRVARLRAALRTAAGTASCPSLRCINGAYILSSRIACG